MNKLRCPTCDGFFEAATSSALPFCSPRCRDVDLGRWLDEAFAVPWTRQEDELEEEAGEAADEQSDPRTSQTGERDEP